MTITTRKIIKIGSSLGVTFPVEEIKRHGWRQGTLLKMSVEEVPERADDEQVRLIALTQKLIKRHSQALKNLSQR